MNSTIRIIVPLYNRARDIQYFIDRLKHLSNDNAELCIVDYQSDDIDLKDAVKSLAYPYRIVQISGTFSKSYALQTGALLYQDNREDLLFLADADVHLPTTIFDEIRKYTVKGESFFAPLYGFECEDGKVVGWEEGDHGGKGNLAITVEDFLRSGGFEGSPMLYKTTWGEEDSFLHDRFCRVVPPRRLRIDGLYARFHPRTPGSWYAASTFDYHLKDKAWWSRDEI